MTNNYLSIHIYDYDIIQPRVYPNKISRSDIKIYQVAQEKKHNSNLAPNTFILSN